MEKSNKEWLGRQRLTKQQIALISDRQLELFFLGLEPFSPASDISTISRQITNTLTAFDVEDYEYEAMWRFLCQQVGSAAKLPLGKNIYKSVKRLLFKFVDKAGFVWQSILGLEGKYIADDYFEQIKRLKRFRTRQKDFYTTYLYSRAECKKIFARASGQYTRACGVASLAQKDGLNAYFLTITLKPEYHRSSPKWDGTTADQSARLLTDRWSALDVCLRNNNVRAEKIRNIEPHKKGGTAHLHATVFTDNSEKFHKLLLRVFSDVADDGPAGIQFDETDNPYRAVLYTIKTIWPCSDDSDSDDWERIQAWKQRVSAQCFSISSNVRKLPPAALFDAHRKGRFTAKNEIEAVEKMESRYSLDWLDLPGGECCVYMHDTYYADADDAVADTNIRLTKAAGDGDFADFTRIFNAATNTRKRSPACKKSGLETAGSLGKLEVSRITELRTIRQVIAALGDRIRDIDDWKWLLRHKYIGKKSRKKVKADKKSAEFMEKFKKSLTSGYQTQLMFC